MLVYQRVNSTRSTKKTQWTGNVKDSVGNPACCHIWGASGNPQGMQSSRLEIIETNLLEYKISSQISLPKSLSKYLLRWYFWHMIEKSKLISPHRFSYLTLASKPYSCPHLHPTSPRVGAWPHGAIITWRIFAASSTNAQLPASRTSQLDQMTNSFP